MRVAAAVACNALVFDASVKCAVTQKSPAEIVIRPPNAQVVIIPSYRHKQTQRASGEKSKKLNFQQANGRCRERTFVAQRANYR
jgi:hypothetical protein